jgi:hypothetical protein
MLADYLVSCTISAGQTFGLGLGAAVHSTIFVSSYLTTWEVGGSRVAYGALALRRIPCEAADLAWARVVH